jgi:hypothetical protein
MRARRPLALAASLAAALAVTACASESDGGGGGGGAGGGGVSGHVGLLPAADGDDPVLVTYADLTRAAEIAGVERPDDPADTDAVADYISTITGLRFEEGETPAVAALVPEVAQTDRAAQLEEFVEDVGWSILQVDTFAERNTPPDRVAVLTGDFDGDQLDEALDDAGDGVRVAGNPQGGIDPRNTTAARPIGETLWLALDDDRLTIAANKDDMEPARDAGGGEGTLAGDETVATLAGALDDHDVYSAMLEVDEAYLSDFADRVLGDRATPEQAEALGDQPRCEGVTGAAAGLADDGGPLVVLVLAHLDESAAAANADVVATALDEDVIPTSGRRWSELLAVESVEADGRAVVVTARPAGETHLTAAYRLLFDRSLPPC